MKKHRKLPGNISNFMLCSVIIVVLSLGGCGKKEEEEPKPPEQVKIKILTMGDQVQEKEFENKIEEFSQAHSEWIVHSTIEVCTTEEVENEGIGLMNDADVVVFPTTMNPTFRQQTQAFHPLSATSTAMPKLFDQAYQMKEMEHSVWALPVLLDPLVMVFKKKPVHLIGEAEPPKTWGKINLMSSRALSKGYSLPHLVLLTGSPINLTDSMTALQSSVGFIQASDGEEFTLDIVSEHDRQSMQDSFAFLHNYISEKEGDLASLPQLTDMQAFMDSDAIMTLTRYSSVVRLGQRVIDQVYMSVVPGERDRVLIPADGYAASIPLNAASPETGKAFIPYLLKQKNWESYLSVNELESPTKEWLKDATFFLPRESMTSINQKWAIDALNGSLRVADYRELWRKAYFLPENFE